MCRLLGVIANKPVDLEFSLKRFKEKYANKNPDGWGLGWYEIEKAKIFKQGISAIEQESLLPRLSKEIRAEIIIAHVRKGTGATPSERNSHPFDHRNWIFAHNGLVDREYLLSLLIEEYKQGLEGETDSEVFFHYLLQWIKEEGDAIEGIEKAVKNVIKRRHSGLNFLLSDGKYLYAFRYSSSSINYYSLYKLRRSPSTPGPLEFKSKETNALIRSKSIKGEKAILVCSEKLTEEAWEEVNVGSLLIIKPDLSMEEVEIL